MNFEQVRQANGQLVTMLAMVVEVGPSKLNRNQKAFRPCKLQDDLGEQHSVTVNQGKGLLIGDAVLGKRCQFSLSTYAGQNGVAYSGFWSDKAQVNQATQAPQTPARVSFPPQNQSKAPTPTVAPKVDWDAKDRRMAKISALRGAVEKQVVMADIAKDLTVVTKDKIIETAEFFLEWIYREPESDLQKQAGDLLAGVADFDQLNAEARADEGECPI
ncbi:MAG: hypothetical protein WC441_04730 [Patescibacteria group bacterium]